MKLFFIKTAKHILCGAALLMAFNIEGKAQNVGMGTTTPDPSAALDVKSDNLGLLIPRVKLQSIDDATTVPAAAHSLLVYNTNENIVGGNGAGLYYNTGLFGNIEWVKLLLQKDSSWSVNGNAKITPTQFLGTIDDNDVIIKRGGIKAAELTAGGVIFSGNTAVSTIPVSGAGKRLVWSPGKPAFRVGEVTSNQWNDALVGVASVAGGFNTVASSASSIAFGESTAATGNGGDIAFGINTIADRGIALGSNTKAALGLAMGASTSTLDAIANGHITDGMKLAAGEGTEASARHTTALGNKTQASESYATTIGVGTKTKNDHSFVMGTWNKIHEPAVPMNNTNNNKIFQIGNGKTEFTRSDAMWVEMDGDVTIAGCLIAKDGTMCGSDIRLKKNIKPLDNVLSKINAIQPISFYFKDKTEFPAGHQIGFSAQEIEKTFPELVKTMNDTKIGDYLSVNYSNMSAVTIQAIKEHQVVINSQKKVMDEQVQSIQQQQDKMAKHTQRIQLLDAQKKSLEKRLAELEKKVFENNNQELEKSIAGTK